MFAKLWKRQPPHMVGIDIGSYNVKAILLSQITNGYKVIAHACVPINKGAVVDHVFRDSKAVVESLYRVVGCLPTGCELAAVAISGSTVITKVIYMDASLSEHEMEAQIEIEADNLIPYPVDEVSLDFEVLAQNLHDSSKVDVLLSACRTENIDNRIDVLDAVGLEAKVVDVEAYALGRSIELLYGPLSSDALNNTLVLVNIGANVSSFAVVDKGETIFIREQSLGGDQLTQNIQSFYGLSYEEAEKAKLSDNLPPDAEFEVLRPFQELIVQQIKRTLQIYSTSTNSNPVDYILLCGGSSKLNNLASLLTKELGIKTELANPFLGCLQANENIKHHLESNIGQYMLACGLALRSYGQWRI